MTPAPPSPPAAAVASAVLPPAPARSAHVAVPGPAERDLLAQVARFDTTKLAPHPRLALTPREIARIRSGLQEPVSAALWASLQKYCAAERGKPIPAEPAGFAGGKWNIDDWRRIGNAAGNVQNHVLGYAFAYAVHRDPADLAEAKRWALAASAWNPDGSTGIASVDHAAHDIVSSLALAYDWLYSDWTPAERATLRAAITARARALYRDLNPYHGDSWNNHPWFVASALGSAGLALADESPEADAWWRYAARLYLTEFLPRGGRDGDWHEGTHYATYTLIFVADWADALRSATGIDAWAADPWLRRVGYFSLYTFPPSAGSADGAVSGIHFNDNNNRPPDFWDRMIAAKLARETRDPVLQWYADSQQVAVPNLPPPAVYTLLYRDPSLAGRAPAKADLPRGVWFRDSGWVVLRGDLTRGDDIQFGLKAGPYLATPGSKGHDHPDQNGFLLNAGGEPLLVDSGYYDYYGSPHHTNWSFTAEAHNTLLVDGKGQLVATQGADGHVTAFASAPAGTDGLDFSESEAAKAYPAGLLQSWRRQVLFLRPGLFLLRDTVRPQKPATLTWLFHGENAFTLDPAAQTFVTRNQRQAVAGRLYPPGGALVLTQWGGFPKNAQPERKKPGDYPDQWHLQAATAGPVSDATLLTLVRPAPAATISPAMLPPLRRSRTGDTEFVTIAAADGADPETRIRFGLAAPAALWTWDGLQSDAAVAARRGEDMVLTAVTRCSRGGSGGASAAQPLFRAAGGPADLSGRLTEKGWQAASIRLSAPAVASLYRPARPASVLVNGKPATGWRWDPARRLVAVSLPEGMSVVVLK